MDLKVTETNPHNYLAEVGKSLHSPFKIPPMHLPVFFFLKIPDTAYLLSAITVLDFNIDPQKWCSLCSSASCSKIVHTPRSKKRPERIRSKSVGYCVFSVANMSHRLSDSFECHECQSSISLAHTECKWQRSTDFSLRAGRKHCTVCSLTVRAYEQQKPVCVTHNIWLLNHLRFATLYFLHVFLWSCAAGVECNTVWEHPVDSNIYRHPSIIVTAGHLACALRVLQNEIRRCRISISQMIGTSLLLFIYLTTIKTVVSVYWAL